MAIAACGDVQFTASEDDEPIETDTQVGPITITVSVLYELLILQQDLDDALNIVFVPDGSYGDIENDITARQAFLDDLAGVINEGYWENNAFFRNLGLVNYFYTTEQGSVTPPTGSGICPDIDVPLTVQLGAAFADLILVLHTNTLRDCRFGNVASSEPTSFRTVVHESGHALFNLPDEYCCDGGYFEVPPVLYAEEADCLSDPLNAAWRDCDTFTGDGSRGDWTRSENSNVDIMSAGGSVVVEFGEADWVVIADVFDDIGTPNTPTVFAPDNWERP